MRRILVSIIAVIVFVTASVHGTDKTWDNESQDGKFSTGSNWNPEGVPGNDDKAIFGSSQTADCSIDTNINVKGIEIQSGYTGTITQGSGKNVTIGSDGYSQAGGTFSGGSGTETIDTNTTTGDFTLSGGTFTSTSGTLYLAHDFTVSGGTFNHNSGEIVCDYYHKTVDTGSAVLNDLRISMGNYSLTLGSDVEVSGNLTITAIGSMTGSGDIKVAGNVTTTDTQFTTSTEDRSCIVMDGDGFQILAAGGGTGMLCGLAINKSGGTLTILDTIKIQQGGWTWAAGTVSAGASTVEFVTGSITIDSGSMEFGSVIWDAGTYSHTVTNTMKIGGTLTLNALGSLGGGSIDLKGNLCANDTQIMGNCLVTLTGTADQEISGGGMVPSFEIEKTGGTVTYSSALSVWENFTYISSGTVSQGENTIIFKGTTGTFIPGSLEYGSIEISKHYTTSSLEISGTADISGNLKLTKGRFNTGTLEASGTEVTVGEDFKGGTGKLALKGVSKTVTAESGGYISDLDIEMGTYGLTLSGDLDIEGALSIISVGAVNSGNLRVAGDITTTDIQVRTTTGAAIEIDGTGPQTLGADGGTGGVCGIIVSKETGALTMEDTIILETGDWIWEKGDVDPGNSTVKFLDGYITVQSGEMWFCNAVFDGGSYSHSIIGTMKIAGDLYLEELGTLSGGMIDLQGSLYLDAEEIRGDCLVKMTGESTQYISGGGMVPHLTIEKTGGELHFSSDFSLWGDYTHTLGTVQTNTGTVIFKGPSNTFTPGSVEYYGVGINKLYTNSGLTVSAPAAVTGVLDLVKGRLAGGTVLAAGIITVESDFEGDQSSGNVIINGDTDQNISGAGMMPETEMDKPSGALILGSDVAVGKDFVYKRGTLSTGSNALETCGAFIVKSQKTFDSVSCSIQLKSDLEIEAGGEIDVSSGTFAFSGTSGQELINNGTAGFSTLSVSNTSAQGVVFRHGCTADVFSCTAPGALLKFMQDETFTFTDLALAGSEGEEIKLRSYTDGSRAKFSVTNDSVSYVDVQDNDASPGNTIHPPANCINSGNNLNWAFEPAVVISQSGGTTCIEEGGADDTYTLNLNTEPASNVTIQISSDAQSETDKSSVVFTPSDWNVLQTVTVSAVDDGDQEGMHTSTVTHTASSSDPDYNGIPVSDVNAEVTDNDVTVTFDPEENTFTENEVPLAITLSSNITGSTMYYTTDGSVPTEGSTEYTGPFDISDDTPVKVIAVWDDAGGHHVSQVFEKEYYLQSKSECYPYKNYGRFVPIRMGETRKYTAQAWWVGPNGIREVTGGDDQRVEEYDDDIVWSCTKGTITQDGEYTHNGYSENGFMITTEIPGGMSETACGWKVINPVGFVDIHDKRGDRVVDPLIQEKIIFVHGTTHKVFKLRGFHFIEEYQAYTGFEADNEDSEELEYDVEFESEWFLPDSEWDLKDVITLHYSPGYYSSENSCAGRCIRFSFEEHVKVLNDGSLQLFSPVRGGNLRFEYDSERMVYALVTGGCQLRHIYIEQSGNFYILHDLENRVYTYEDIPNDGVNVYKIVEAETQNSRQKTYFYYSEIDGSLISIETNLGYVSNLDYKYELSYNEDGFIDMITVEDKPDTWVFSYTPDKYIDKITKNLASREWDFDGYGNLTDVKYISIVGSYHKIFEYNDEWELISAQNESVSLSCSTEGDYTYVTSDDGDQRYYKRNISTGFGELLEVGDIDDEGQKLPYFTFTYYDNSSVLKEKKYYAVDEGTGESFVWQIIEYTYTESGDVKNRTVKQREASSDPFAEITYRSREYIEELINQGRLKTKQDQNGFYTLFSYDDHGNCTEKRYLMGTFEYPDEPESNDPNDDIVYTYTYSGSPWKGWCLETEADPMGYTTSYTYNGFNKISSKTDPEDNIWTYGYDSKGRQTSVTSPRNYLVTIEYYTSGPKEGLVKKVTGPLGNITDYSYEFDYPDDGYGWYMKATRTGPYAPGDPNPPIFKKKFNVSQSPRIRRKLLKYIRGGEGKRGYKETLEILDRKERRDELEQINKPGFYDLINDGVVYTDENQVKTRVQRTDLVLQNLRKIEITENWDTSNERTTTYYYNLGNRHPNKILKGKLVLKNDPEGNTTYWTYYNNGKVKYIDYPDGSFVRKEYYPDGKLKKEIKSAPEHLGYFNETEYKYDPLGNLIEKRFKLDPNDSNDDMVFTCEYFDNGWQKSVRQAQGEMALTTNINYYKNGAKKKVVKPDDSKIYWEYDKDGNMELIQVLDSNDNVINQIIQEVDGNKQVTKKEFNDRSYTTFSYTPSGLIDTIIEGLIEGGNNEVTTSYSYEYDNDNYYITKIQETKEERMSETYTTWNGVTYKNILPNNVTIDFQLNNFYEVEKRTIDPTGENLIVEYEYNKNGDNAKIIAYNSDTGNQTTQYSYNKAGKLKKTIDADGSIRKNIFDSYGFLKEQEIKEDENTTLHHFSIECNSFGNIIKISDYNNPGTIYKTFEYNNILNEIKESVDYNSASDNSDDVVITNTFDNNTGQLLLHEMRIGASGATRTVEYQYNDGGMNDRIIYPQGDYVEFGYNVRNSIDSIYYNGSDNNHLVCGYTFDSFNRIDSKTIKNNGGEIVSLDILYNDYSEMEQYKWTQNSGSTTLLDYQYGYNDIGLRLYKFKAHNDDNSELYQYDTAGRLIDFKRGTLSEPDRDSISGTPVTQEQWTLDELYNWKSWIKDTQTENRTHNLVNELTARDSQNFTYDGKGNLTADGTYTYEYDVFNRLVEIKEDSVTKAEYIYDASDRRIAKVVHEGTETTNIEYVLSVDNQIIEEYKDGVYEKSFVYGLYIDEPLMMELDSAEKYFYCTDAQYSITVMLDETGDIVEGYDYTPYGTMEVYTDAGTDSTWFTDDDEYNESDEIGNPFRYTGRYYDKESSLFHFRARYYSPELGRFLSRDPVGFTSGYNLYAAYFTLNDLDPTGNFNLLRLIKDTLDKVFEGLPDFGRAINAAIIGMITDKDHWWYENTKCLDIPTWPEVLQHWKETPSLEWLYKLHVLWHDKMGIDSPADYVAFAIMAFGPSIPAIQGARWATPILQAISDELIFTVSDVLLNEMFGTPEKADWFFNPDFGGAYLKAGVRSIFSKIYPKGIPFGDKMSFVYGGALYLPLASRWGLLEPIYQILGI